LNISSSATVRKSIYENDPKVVIPNVLIGGPVKNSPGFPLKACGNDGLLEVWNGFLRSDLQGLDREILLKNSRSSFENLRTNGARFEIVGDLPFMLSPVEAFLEIFSRVKEIKLETRR
jgi:hypothetical protein